MLKKMNLAVVSIKSQKPLILNFTNYVTMDFVANGLLSIGALPLMCNAKQEIEDLVEISNAVVINLGTLDDSFVRLCELACQAANKFNKPIIFDPVGAGASQYRTSMAKRFIHDYTISILRGNASEIMALVDVSVHSLGVETTKASDEAIPSARHLSKIMKATIVVSGKIDIIVNGERIKKLDCGSPFMTIVTGMGCLLTAIIAAFHCVESDGFDAAVFAALFYGRCGEIAAENVSGSGMFKSKFLDLLGVTPEILTYAE
jgi:hydroxyethylthiazole kinase